MYKAIGTLMCSTYNVVYKIELPEVGTAVTVYVIYESCVLCLPQSHSYNLIS